MLVYLHNVGMQFYNAPFGLFWSIEKKEEKMTILVPRCVRKLLYTNPLFIFFPNYTSNHISFIAFSLNLILLWKKYTPSPFCITLPEKHTLSPHHSTFGNLFWPNTNHGWTHHGSNTVHATQPLATYCIQQMTLRHF